MLFAPPHDGMPHVEAASAGKDAMIRQRRRRMFAFTEVTL
jgi:hypothetical protein